MMQPHGIPTGVAMPPKKTSPVIWVLGGCGVLLLMGGIFVSALVWWGYRKAKSYADQAGQMNTVAYLWSDVPPLEGMTPSQQAELPFAIRALARTLLDGMLRGPKGEPTGHWDVAFYVLGGKTTHDVEAFYVPVRMAKYGWQQQGGCTNSSQVTFCSFLKQGADSKSGLLVIAADDPEHKSASLTFIRQDAPEKGNTPGGP